MEEKKICFVDLYKEFLVFQKKKSQRKKTMAFLFFFFLNGNILEKKKFWGNKYVTKF